MLVTLATVLFARTAWSQTPDPSWEYEPYHVHAVVALDVPGGAAQYLEQELPSFVANRADGSIGRLWDFRCTLATGILRDRILSDVESYSETPQDLVPDERGDKLVLIAVRWRPDGYTITAREYDGHVRRWSPPIHRHTRQQQSLCEHVFALLCRAVSPLAKFELESEDEKHIVLKFRGAALMNTAGESWVKQGDVFLPVLRRTSRSGELVDDGIRAVPFTYVQVVEQKAEKTLAKIYSGTRMPFSARRQGRVEQVAIALRADPADTSLMLRARGASPKPLIGYELFAQNNPKKPEELTLIGATDVHGAIAIPPGKSGVRLVYVKNGGRLLARLPIAAGALQKIEVALPDDDARLAAELRLNALREDLVDVVARRNILMARVRQKIKEKDFEAAQSLLNQINELPGRSQFNLQIANAARRLRSEDPQIQRRIDQLFEGTQTALTQYLDVRPVSELSNELRAAQQEKGS